MHKFLPTLAIISLFGVPALMHNYDQSRLVEKQERVAEQRSASADIKTYNPFRKVIERN